MSGESRFVSQLSGGPASIRAWESSVGKEIGLAVVCADELRFYFHDDTILALMDDGDYNSNRYMVCDDDLPYFAGAILLDAEIADAGESYSDEGWEHDVQFLHVKTSTGSFTVSNHSEHNGCYGGFCIKAELRHVKEIKS